MKKPNSIYAKQPLICDKLPMSKSVNTVIPCEGFEISIICDDCCGTFDILRRSSLVIFDKYSNMVWQGGGVVYNPSYKDIQEAIAWCLANS